MDSDFPEPLRHFLAQLDELRSAGIPDMDRVGRLLTELAADEEYFGPLTAEMPSESPGGKWLVKPERGPRLVLFHRPEGVMAYTHSHHCWVGIAPVRGVETHQRWDALRHGDGRAELRLADDRAMHCGDVATLTPPGDIHNHGHVLGTGPSPYSLILLGDDMYLFEREEYDPRQGIWRNCPETVQPKPGTGCCSGSAARWRGESGRGHSVPRVIYRRSAHPRAGDRLIHAGRRGSATRTHRRGLGERRAARPTPVWFRGAGLAAGIPGG